MSSSKHFTPSLKVRIAVFGAGANGGAIAAALADAGADVTAIDPWAAHIEAIRSHGLTVTTPKGTQISQVKTLHLCELAHPAMKYDLIVLGVKAYDTRWSCELLLPYLSDNGTVVAVQNGLTLDVVAETFGLDRSVGAVIEVASNLMTPATIEQQAPMWLALGGETPVSRARAAWVAEVLESAATTRVIDDIRSAKWMKLVANACELVTSAVLDLPLAEATSLPGMYEFMVKTGQEALDTALANGHEIVEIFAETNTDTPARATYVRDLLDAVLRDYTRPNTLTAVLQDWRKGRRAEIHEINGEIVSRAQAGVPYNRRTLEIALMIESRKLQAQPSNLVLLTTGYE
ncbi:MAG: ketopantoate reductase family protein [Gulosibacter sp.]|uniref:ketopantoate reductase family protein n=1 Tax=Gulosibacter sp. TaxID=2817531 RepID=UPI003F93D3CB